MTHHPSASPLPETCDNCGSDQLARAYRAADTQRALSVHVCQRCGLAQSLPRNGQAARRPPTVSSGADWGNVRYGKGFRTDWSLAHIQRHRPLQAMAAVLDVGANRGSFLQAFAQARPGTELWGVEPDARVTQGLSDLPGLTLLHDRVENIALPESHFDLVYCSHTLEHVASARAVLVQLRRTLKPGGLLFAEVPNLAAISEANMVEEFFIDKHLYHYTDTTFADVLRVAGFDILSTEVDAENVTLIATPAAAATLDRPAPAHADEPVRASGLIGAYAARLAANRQQLRAVSDKITALAQTDRVCIWGGGRIFDSLVSHGGFDPQSLCGLIDRELPKYVDQIHGRPVLLPAEFAQLAPSVLVIASRAYEAEIRAQAEGMAHWPLKTIALFDLMETH